MSSAAGARQSKLEASVAELFPADAGSVFCLLDEVFACGVCERCPAEGAYITLLACGHRLCTKCVEALYEDSPFCPWFHTEGVMTVMSSPDLDLLTAVERLDLEAINRAIAAGADVEVRDGQGFTPLLLAVADGSDRPDEQMAAIRLLCEKHNADVNAANNFGMTALHIAANNADMRLLRYLTARPGVDFSKRDSGSYMAHGLATAVECERGAVFLHRMEDTAAERAQKAKLPPKKRAAVKATRAAKCQPAPLKRQAVRAEKDKDHIDMFGGLSEE